MLECLFNKVAGLKGLVFHWKRRLQHRCFLKKFLRTPLCRRPNCLLCFLEILCDDIIFWTSFCTKVTFFIFLVPLLWFPSWSMVIPYLLSHQIFSKCKCKKQLSNCSQFCQQFIVKTVNMSLLNIMLCYYFF